MAKYRIVSKGSLVTIKSRLTRGEQINEREVEYLMTNYTRGLFKVFYDGKKNIEYTAPMSLPLEKYLKGRILEEVEFWKIIAQIVKVAKTVEISGLYLNNLCMDMNNIFINEVTLELYFIYQPLRESRNTGNAFAVINDITYLELKNRSGVQSKYLVEFQNFLNQGNHYRMEQIKDYIISVCPEINEVIHDAERGRSGFLTTDPAVYEEHYEKQQNFKDREDTVCLNSEDTVVLGTDTEDAYGETTVLAGNKTLTLLHQKDGERMEMLAVPGALFRLGKSRENDYCIRDNSAVSRKHAYITRTEDEFYLSDENSTNGTFLNGRRLEAGVSAQLADGDEIVLADEVLIVEIK